MGRIIGVFDRWDRAQNTSEDRFRGNKTSRGTVQRSSASPVTSGGSRWSGQSRHLRGCRRKGRSPLAGGRECQGEGRAGAGGGSGRGVPRRAGRGTRLPL